MIFSKLTRTFMALFIAMTIHVTAVQAQPAVTDSIDNIFSLAESKLSEYFPSGAVTQYFDNYVYRFYDATGIYLAFDDNNVYLLGGAFGSTVVNIGSIASIEAALLSYQDAVASGELWNLRVSGTASFFGQTVDFSDIALDGVPAPDITDTQAISDSVNEYLAGLVTDISAITIVVVSDSENQRIIDVSFSASANGVSASYDLRLSFTR